MVAAGRRADLVVFEDLVDFRARLVIADGRIVARDGVPFEPAPRVSAAELKGSMKIGPLAASDFRVRSNESRVRVATIDQPRFTRWGEAQA